MTVLAVALLRDFNFGSPGLFLRLDIHNIINTIERDVLLGPFDVDVSGNQLDADIVLAVEQYCQNNMGIVFGPGDSARILSKIK